MEFHFHHSNFFTHDLRIGYKGIGRDARVVIDWKNPFPNAGARAIGFGIVVIASVWAIWLISISHLFFAPKFGVPFKLVWFLPIAIATFLLIFIVMRGVLGSRMERLTLSSEVLNYQPSRVPSAISLTYDQVSRASVAKTYGNGDDRILQQILTLVRQPEAVRISRANVLKITFALWGEGPECEVHCPGMSFFIGPFVSPSNLRAISRAIEGWSRQEGLDSIYRSLKQDLVFVGETRVVRPNKDELLSVLAKVPLGLGIALNQASKEIELKFKTTNSSNIGTAIIIAAILVSFGLKLSLVIGVAMCWLLTTLSARYRRISFNGSNMRLESGIYPCSQAATVDLETIIAVRQVRNEISYTLYVDKRLTSLRLIGGLNYDVSNWIGKIIAAKVGCEFFVSETRRKVSKKI